MSKSCVSVACKGKIIPPSHKWLNFWFGQFYIFSKFSFGSGGENLIVYGGGGGAEAIFFLKNIMNKHTSKPNERWCRFFGNFCSVFRPPPPRWHTNPGKLWSHPLKYFLSHLSIFVLSLWCALASHTFPGILWFFLKSFFHWKFITQVQ